MDRLEHRDVLGALAGCSRNRGARYSRRTSVARTALHWGILSFPLVLVVTVFVAAATAFVAFAFFSPVLVVWLAVYLVAIFGLARALPSTRSARLAASSPHLSFGSLFVRSGDRLVDDVSLAVICGYGLLAKPWPTNPAGSNRSAGATPA